MQILKNVSKAELDYLTSQPTAKALIEKNKAEAINIAKGDVKGAAAFVASRKREKQEDALEISDAGLAALKKSLEASSNSKGVKITKNDNSYNVLFKNVAYAYRAVKHGYIDIDGEKFVLSDKVKSELKKTADEAFNQMQNDTLTATAKHNAHVLQQQAEAIRNAGKNELDFWEMLLNNDEEEEWISPLKQLENHSVTMDFEKTQGGFSVMAISIAEGYL
ncbi:MAG: hypothetical protein IJZ42_00295 [Lachnospiraceae bacterium]|nr:hypothetical protein [Lachnospiraceae bacterium]